eukprot:4441046-Pleurochrysis_carterae.AAC.1
MRWRGVADAELDSEKAGACAQIASREGRTDAIRKGEQRARMNGTHENGSLQERAKTENQRVEESSREGILGKERANGQSTSGDRGKKESGCGSKGDVVGGVGARNKRVK